MLCWVGLIRIKNKKIKRIESDRVSVGYRVAGADGVGATSSCLLSDPAPISSVHRRYPLTIVTLLVMASEDGVCDDDTVMAVINTDVDESGIGTGNVLSPESVSPNAERMRELVNACLLTRIELDLTYASEKLLNLDMLLADMGAKASDYDPLPISDDDAVLESLSEFDLLTAVLDAEVKEMDFLLHSVQMDIVDAREKISYCTKLEESFLELGEKLHGAEESLTKLQDQLTEIRTQCTEFRSKINLYLQEQRDSEVTSFTGNSQTFSTDTKLKMQTTEQQRHILKMLEKSLAREMELENKLSDSINNKEELLMKISYAEREIFCLEGMAESPTEKLLEAENLAEVLGGVSKELMGKLQLSQFYLNNSRKKEEEMKSSFDSLEKQLEDSKTELQKVKGLMKASQDQQVLLQTKISNLEALTKELKTDIVKAEGKAQSAEARCKSLEESNLELTHEGDLLRTINANEEKIDLLEKQVKQSEVQLQHSKAMIEANQEKQAMLYSALSDMENLINDLKAKVLKTESRAEIAENNCITLSETNSELNEALVILKRKIDCLEESLYQADEEKISISRDIGIRSKVITDLVLQLGMERQRLQIQITSLAKENNFLTGKYSKSNASDNSGKLENENIKESALPKDAADKTQSSKSFEQSAVETSVNIVEVDNFSADLSKSRPLRENKTESSLVTENREARSVIDMVRTIEPSQLSFKYVVMALLVLLASVLSVYFFHPVDNH